MREGSPRTIFRRDYQPPTHLVETVELRFDIHDEYTLVDSTLILTEQEAGGGSLVLDGEGLTIESIEINGERLGEEAYHYDGSQLTIAKIGKFIELRTRVRIHPATNSSLEGLYRSGPMYCTQCEAEGFRKITFFPDRPDVLATFRVTIEADQKSCPVLLSNGNPESTESLPNGRHRAVWYDPWPKPGYLFALVAGDLECVSDTYTTASGKDVALRIYVEAKDVGYCDHAMVSLKHSMAWDERVYGLEYDLDLFNIVAVDDFNMGAMENKSLNIFNTSCVLAAPEITTDAGYQRIEAIVAHEYFHNYSGNRVTCRDWFQLSLKEGLTVFRDAEFTADMNSRGVKRVEDTASLRTHQFAEDSGPMAHPIRPDSFIEISNFYTLTVYEKGAEVVRMLHTLLGHDIFIAGARLYFTRHDGQAATCEDFVTAMEDASGRDLRQFRRWYEQAGTPTLTVEDNYDPDQQRYSLLVRQANPQGAEACEPPPLHIPLAVGLLVNGTPLPLEGSDTTRLLEVTEKEQRFEFNGVEARPVPSLLRGFSAPVRLQSPGSEADLQALIAGEDDDFVRWDAMQRYATRVIDEAAAGDTLDEGFFAAYEEALGAVTDPAMKALLLAMPSEDYLADGASGDGAVDVFQIRASREQVRAEIAGRFESQWRSLYQQMAVTEPFVASGDQIGRRALSHLALDYLCCLPRLAEELALPLFERADNLTDRLAGLRMLVNHGSATQRASSLQRYFSDWESETLAINQWFTLQALRPDPSIVETIIELQNHPAFDWLNPNKVRAVIGAFANGNPIGFHRKDGAGYTLVADAIIRLQGDNPRTAARLCGPLSQYRRYAHGVEQMQEQLHRIAAVKGLSRDVFEVVERSLKA